MLPFEDLFDLVKSFARHAEPTIDPTCSPKAVIVSSADLVTICSELHRNENTFFDMLSCITAIDNGSAVNTMEVIYSLYSIPFDKHLTLKVILPRENAVLDSVVKIWRTADWHEREAYDMFGIHFYGHPDL